MPAGKALWLPRKNGAFSVGPAPDTPPGPKQIVIRARAIAVNPIDRYLPTMARFITPWLEYPAVVGSDVAGEVVAVGPGVTRFKPGDRVLGAASSVRKGGSAAEGAFQEYVLLDDVMTSPIPDKVSFEVASVVPLGLCTAASGMFQQDYLGLRHPSAAPTPSGEIFIVWGGSTSVGSNAIQLAVAAGYEVISTASPRNFDYLKRLGASAAFDYSSRTVAADIIAVIAGRPVAGALAIGSNSTNGCLDILGACTGRKFIAEASQPVSLDGATPRRGGILGMLPVMLKMTLANRALTSKARRNKVEKKFIWGGSLRDNEVGPMIYESFLPQALADGRFVCAPDPIVVGHGVEAIPQALDALGRGVSAGKVVVTL